MRLLDQLVGHQETIEKILESFEAGRPGQTFLFVGPSGVGKKQVALGLAQALLCERSRRACGQCDSCLRLSRGQNEALLLVEPQGTQIKIDQARQILDKLSFKAISENRVIIINEAQLLNPQASNSLLKILEEPPAGTFFFLIAPTQAGLLPTIRSRSRIVQFKPLSESEVAQKSSAPKWMIKASGGSFERLKTLEEGPEQETRQKAIELLQIFLNDADFLTNENWRGPLKERAQAQKYFTYWVSFLRDALCLIHDVKGAIVNLDQPALIKALATQDPSHLLSLMQKFLQSEKAFGSNQDGVLVLEKIWITDKHHVD